MTSSGGRVAPVTVAVVSWNTRELLVECLASLRDDADSGLADVWVVDNASADGSAEAVAERFPYVSLIASTENLGFGAAVNEIAANTSSPWIAPANADLRLHPGALRRLLQEGHSHPEAGAIAPRLILPDQSTQHSVYPFPTIPFTLAYVSGLLRISSTLSRRWCMNGGFDPEHRREVPWAVGAFLLVRRTAWEQVGGFDRQQWMYTEDLDLGWRLRRAGWSIRYEPDALIDHNESAATRQAWGDRRFARWHASTYAWLIRRRGAFVARVIAAINIAGFMIRAGVAQPGALARRKRSRTARTDALNAARAHLVGLRPRRAVERMNQSRRV